MPALEMAQETGKLVSWLKHEGDTVAKGDLLFEIETDKAVMEIEAAADGLLAGITGEPGTDIPVGHTIAWILAAGEKVPVGEEAAEPAPRAVAEAAAKPPQAATVEATVSEPNQISPKARRMAKEAGIDLAQVKGTGANGEIQTADVQALMDAKAAQGKSSSGSVPSTLSAVGRLMAERTTQSWTTVPHFFLRKEVDASALNELRLSSGAEIQQSHGVKLTHTDLLIAIVARTLARHPRVNSSWIGEAIQTNPDVNIALAMAVEGGVVSAVIAKADSLPLGEIAKQRQDYSERARAGRLRPADLSGATFTISNLGMFQIDSFSAIIVQPQAAILAVGSIADRVVAVEGKPVVRPMLSLTLSSDHRVLDGATAAVFLRDLAAAIQSPEFLLAK